MMGIPRFKIFLCLFSEVAHPPPATAIRPWLQTTLFVTSLFLLSFLSRWWKRNDLGGLSRQGGCNCDQGAELPSALAPHIPAWAFLSCRKEYRWGAGWLLPPAIKNYGTELPCQASGSGKNWPLKIYPGCSVKGQTEVATLILLNWHMEIVHHLESQAFVKSMIARF